MPIIFDYALEPLGDVGIVIRFNLAEGEGAHAVPHDGVRALARRINRIDTRGVLECVPAYMTVTVFYNARRLNLRRRNASVAAAQSFGDSSSAVYETLCTWLRGVIVDFMNEANEIDEDFSVRTVDIPVLYGAEPECDLNFVAQHTALTPDEVIEIHAGGDYRVQAIGFAPGFPYLAGLDPRLTTPRRPRPRPLVAEGTIGMCARQTGIYSIASPGGWQLIGRTPLKLFRPHAAEPSLLRAGDRVRFRRITATEFATLDRQEAANAAARDNALRAADADADVDADE